MTKQGNQKVKSKRTRGPSKATLQATKLGNANGMSPLEYMLKVMRDTKADRGRRDDMAKAAAPYIHPKLATLQSNVSLSGKLTLEQLVTSSLPKAAESVDEKGDGE